MNPNESLQVSSVVPKFIANGREYPLNAGPLRIGRAADNEVVIDDESVSSHHALISGNNGTVMVTDLQSTNGTFINGQRIMVAPLSGTMALSIGSVQCSFTSGQSSERPASNAQRESNPRVSEQIEEKVTPKGPAKRSESGLSFSIKPRSDRGMSVMVAFVVIVFFNWLYMPLGMFLILAFGLGILTGIRYLVYQFRGSKAQALNRGSQSQVATAELPDIRPLWKRSPFITAGACLILTIFLNWENSSTSEHLMEQYAAQFSRIQQESEGYNSFGSSVVRGIEAFAYGYAGDVSRGFELDREVDQTNQTLEGQATRLSFMYRLSKDSKQAADRAANLGIICLLGLVGFLIYDHRKRSLRV